MREPEEGLIEQKNAVKPQRDIVAVANLTDCFEGEAACQSDDESNWRPCSCW
jgi:hypothetical protein